MRKLCLTILMVLLLLPSLSLAALPGLRLKNMGIMTGQVFLDSQPLGNAMAAFFLESKGLPPVPGSMVRIPEFLARLDSEGRFAIRLAPGKYYLGLLVRDAAEGPGPPRPGENYYFAVNEAGDLRLLEIAARENLETGRIDAALPEIFAGLAAKDSTGFFTVKGTVLDKSGAPYQGAIVLGKQDLSTPRPEFISNRTAADGSFTLSLPAGKQFFLIARETIAGARPLPGQKLGTYGIKSENGFASPVIYGTGGPPPGVLDENKDSTDRALTVSAAKDATVSNIEIFMYAVPDPREIKASIQGTAGSPKFETGAGLNNVFFDFNSRQLNQQSFAELDRWIAFLQGMEAINAEINGHTDSLGPDDYNLELSIKRAGAVADYLIGRGISSSRVTVHGFGETGPVADNESEAGRKLNRRVEIKFSNSN